MSRKVFSPPSTQAGQFWTYSGALVITLGVFLALPLTQMISGGSKKALAVTRMEASIPPPPPPPLETPPPPPEPEPEQPKPDLQQETQQLSLSDLDLDFGAGGGGVLGVGLGSFGDDEAGMNDLAIFDIADLDKGPQVIAAMSPRTSGLPKISGTVIVLFIVNENGQAVDPRVESVHHPAFEKPTLDAIKRWKFRPGMKDGNPVSSYVRQSIPFQFK
jgi:periplasmic protein TonB